MKTEQNKDNTTKELIRKPLPQSSVIGKRKEIFDLTSAKDKKKTNN